MTAFDRIERRLPELLDELAPASLPDYFDDMLQATTRSRQRPAWSALERWLPMGVIARPLPMRPIPWRLIALVAAIGLLAAATLIYVGSQRRVPAPFGPAANGALVIGTADGDIVTVDPATGQTTVLVGGPTFDEGPYFSNDGRRFAFDRKASASDPQSAMFIANADGSGVRQLLPTGTDLRWFEWSPTDDRILITMDGPGKGIVSTVNLADGKRTDLALGLDVLAASWRPNHDQLVVTAKDGDNVSYWIADLDGSGPRQIATSPYAINEPTLSPDGTKLVYATWEAIPGAMRIVDVDNGEDRPTTATSPAYLWQDPVFSPDGTRLLAYQFIQNSDPPVAELAVIELATGSVTGFGQTNENPQPAMNFSPDGTKIVVTYADGTTWMFDADGSHPQQQAWSAPAGLSWQRNAR